MTKRKNAFYPLALFSYNLSTYAFSNRIQFFYIDVLGIGAAAISAVWLLFGIWNAVNDPLMGQLTDRTRSRWGRRVPYLRFGAIPLAIAFFLMWTPLTVDSWVTVAYFLLAIFVYDTLSTLLFASFNALFVEITGSLKERANLAALRETMGGVGLILAFILAPILSRRLGYPAMGAIIGVVVLIGYMVSTIGIHENPARQDEEVVGFRESVRRALDNRPFRWFLGAALMREFNFITLSATVPFWYKYALNIEGDAVLFGLRLGPGIQEAALLGVPFVLAIPCLQIWRTVAARIGPRRAWMAASLAWIPGLLVIFLANCFGTGLLGTALIAPGMAGYMMLFVMTLSEIADYDAVRTGQHREGSLFGIAGLFMRLAFSVQAILFALMLEPSGYVADAAAQPAAAVTAIRAIMALAPIGACLISVACLSAMRIPKITAQPQPVPAT